MQTDTTTRTRITGMSPILIVANLEHSIEFYVEKLNFEIDFRYEDFYAGIIREGYSVHLKSGKHFFEERKSKRINEDVDILFSVDNIEDLYQGVISKSVDIVQPLRNMPYGKEFYIADPDSNIIGFLGQA